MTQSIRTAALAAALLATSLHPSFGQAAPDATAPAVTAPAPPDTATPAPLPEATVPAPPPIANAPIAPAPDQTPDTISDKPTTHSNRFRIGPEVGVYLPTDSKTRDRFGSSWFSLGLGFGAIDTVKSSGQLGLDLSLQYQKHNGNRIFLLPIGLGYRVALTKNAAAKSVPYVGLTGDLVLADIRSVPDDVHSGIRTGVGGSALIGVNFGDNGNLEARYQLTSRIKSFDFSGLDLTAGYRF